jgi:hypothetical protein
MEWDFNDVTTATSESAGRVSKLPTHGGAIAAFVGVDCYSGVLHGQLLKSTGNTLVPVEQAVLHWELHGHKVELVSADQGVISQSKFQVMTTKVVDWCHRRGIRVEIAEPYNHSRGTASVERAIRSIKELMRMAFHYYKMNPNNQVLGFPERDVLKLWGEIFHWAIAVINLKPSRVDPSKSKYELFYGIRPNMQNRCLLPIFATVLVPVDPPAGSYTRQKQYKNALYVGPCDDTPGAIRCAVMTKVKLQPGEVKEKWLLKIKRTSQFTAATDGGGLNIYPHVNRGVSRLIAEKQQEQQQIHSLEAPDIQAEGVQVDLVATEPVPHATVDAEVVGRILAPRGDPPLRRSQRLLELMKKKSEEVQQATEVRQAAEEDGLKASLEHSATMCDLLKLQLELVQSACEDVGKDEEANFADWSTHFQDDFYFNFDEGKFIQVTGDVSKVAGGEAFAAAELVQGDIEEGYAAVTTGVPKTFAAALNDHVWGEPARIEWQTLLDTNAIVKVSKEFAESQLKDGADLVYLFPVYEVKMREGMEVRKVRLVGDGRTHYSAGNTYASTPSREELLILLHLIANHDWEYVHVDEKRAFLSAVYKGEKPAFTKLRGNSDYYQVLGALYGLKTSPKDYQTKVAERFLSLGYTRLAMCGCIYTKRVGDSLVIVYAFVDDFIFTGSSDRSVIEAELTLFRQHAQTTEPQWDAPVLLGIELERDREKRIITCKMTKKIDEICERCDDKIRKVKLVPMPQSGYVIGESKLDELGPEDAAFLSRKDQLEYMALVGGLIWISGIRHDILFAVLYLTWSTHNPRGHHLRMAYNVIAYLKATVGLDLVLGGGTELRIIAFSDASLGTGPKGRSIIAYFIRLGEHAGAVAAKTRSTMTVCLSSFECEFDGAATALKGIQRTVNVLVELQQKLHDVPILLCDNRAMLEFIQGNSDAKAVRHMALRMWYVREKFLKG